MFMLFRQMLPTPSRTVRNSIFSLAFVLSFLLAGIGNATQQLSHAFWYANNPPIDLLSQFDRIVVQPGNISNKEIQQLQQHGGKILAYLSIGEDGLGAASGNAALHDAVLGENTAWQTSVMDLSSPAWQQHLIEKAQVFLKRGIDGFFLDTMDSYQLPELSSEQKAVQQKSLIDIVQRIHALGPDIPLTVNRGFEVIETIAPFIEAMAAESLYQSWDNGSRRYQPVPEEDRNWLRSQLTDIQSEYNLHIVVLDYLPPAKRTEARELALKIAQEGFIPWIATPSLDYMGIGLIEAVPRKILMLYDSAAGHVELVQNAVFWLAALPLEYQGYIPTFVDIQQGLPQGILRGRYSGIVSWLEDTPATGYRKWVRQHMHDNIPVAVLGDTTIFDDPGLAAEVGVQSAGSIETNALKIEHQSSLIGFETSLPPRIAPTASLVIKDDSGNTSHLRMVDGHGKKTDLAVTGNWGGICRLSRSPGPGFRYRGLLGT